MPQIPHILSEIRDYLASCEIVLGSAEDGRIASANDEQKIIAEITARFDGVQTPDKLREWWDFAVVDGQFLPVNIKISEFVNANDNLNCKLGIYYALTGRVPDLANEIGWEKFFRRLYEDMRETDKDYYFLVINKLDTSDILVQGLKTIPTLQPNGNNLPFQCCWAKNRQLAERTFDEARDFLLSHLAESVKLRSKIYVNFCRYFSQYMKVQ